MQDYPIIGLVLVVSVSSPIARFDMNLYISLYYPLFGGNNGITEVSTLVIVTSPWVDYPYWLILLCNQLSSV